MLEAVLTALVAGFTPWTLLIVAGLLGRDRPMHHALVFLTSAAVVTLLVGFLVVEALGSSGLENPHRHRTVSPAIDLGLGLAILLFLPYLVHRMHREPKPKKPKKPAKPHWWSRSGERRRREAGGLLVVIALGVYAGSPSPLYLASLHSLTKSQPDGTVGALEVLLVGVLFLLLAWVPIILFAMAPERTTALLKNANAWLGRHGRTLVLLAAAAAGCYFTVIGLVHL